MWVLSFSIYVFIYFLISEQFMTLLLLLLFFISQSPVVWAHMHVSAPTWGNRPARHNQRHEQRPANYTVGRVSGNAKCAPKLT